LGIPGETVWQVSSLCLPDGEGVTSPQDLVQCESAQLFVARARAVKSDFELTEENARAVAQICRRLDGLPLAIELAAARINVLSAQEIAARLDDPFNLLTAGNRAALPRHQTLRAAMDWSYAQLTAPEQRLFRQLAILEGRFTLSAIEAAAHGSDGSHLLDLLTRLVAKSLVIAEQNGAGQTRYRMLETIREYAREKFLENVGDGATR
jgi:predicted ATPase